MDASRPRDKILFLNIRTGFKASKSYVGRRVNWLIDWSIERFAIGLFNDALKDIDYTASNDRTTLNDKLKHVLRQWSWSIYDTSEHLSEGLTKHKENRHSRQLVSGSVMEPMTSRLRNTSSNPWAETSGAGSYRCGLHGWCCRKSTAVNFG
jgi:hypothetical protein